MRRRNEQRIDVLNDHLLIRERCTAIPVGVSNTKPMQWKGLEQTASIGSIWGSL